MLTGRSVSKGVATVWSKIFSSLTFSSFVSSVGNGGSVVSSGLEYHKCYTNNFKPAFLIPSMSNV